ncbi:hypothetical protein LTR53_001735 [Teratosphaeriaceae sp. CCFEE 6253]|nr:hypothetical protein LTR53_001735 [Teratosphaeriaceae sp. CCFEE 6253]
MCPPGVDQTCRSGQRWNLLSPAIAQRETLRRRNGEGVTPQRFLSTEHDFGAFDKLARLPARIARASIPILAGFQDSRSIGDSRHGLTPIERLPVELLGIVLADADLEPTDVIAVGMCSRELWAHALFHIQGDVVTHTGAWAGKPLLCSGTWLTDLPPAIYSRFPVAVEAEAKYQSRPVSVYGGGRSARSWYGPCPARVWNYSMLRSEDLEGQSVRLKWLKAFDAFSPGRIESADLVLTKRLDESLRGVVESHMSHEPQDWVLRNLDTQEFVRLQRSRLRNSTDADRILESSALHLAGAPWLSLAHALLLRICWGSVTGGREEGGKVAGLVRGQWAGQCFDVVEETEGLGAGWEDITSELIDEGSHWKCTKAAERDS